MYLLLLYSNSVLYSILFFDYYYFLFIEDGRMWKRGREKDQTATEDFHHTGTVIENERQDFFASYPAH